MRAKSKELKQLQGTFEPSKEVESVEISEWNGKKLPAASTEWPPRIQALWNRRCSDLQKNGYLAEAFLVPLRRYCFAVMMAEEAERNLISGGFVVQEVGTQGQVYEVASKWITVLEKANKTIETISSKFGFSPIDAIKIPKVKKVEGGDENLLA